MNVNVNPNQDIIDIFKNFQKYYLKHKDIKNKAYGRIVSALEKVKFKITNGSQVKDLHGIGKAAVDKINEYIKTGTIKKYNDEILPYLESIEPKEKVISVFENIWRIGPKKAETLYQQGYRSLDDLVANDELDEKQMLWVIYYDDLTTKIPRQNIKIFGFTLYSILSLAFGYDNFKFMVAGSYRRGALSSGDMDVLISSKHFDIIDVVKVLREWDLIVEELVGDKEKFMCLAQCKGGLGKVFRLDIEFLEEKYWGSGLLYFTGNKNFNTRMRLLAKENGYRLNEHGLYVINPKNGIVGSRVDHLDTEEDYMRFFGMPYFKPEERI